MRWVALTAWPSLAALTAGFGTAFEACFHKMCQNLASRRSLGARALDPGGPHPEWANVGTPKHQVFEVLNENTRIQVFLPAAAKHTVNVPLAVSSAYSIFDVKM